MAAPVYLRPAERDEDLEFLSALAGDPAVEPFLAPGRGEPSALAELASLASEPPAGLYMIEAPRDQPVGGLALAVVNRRSRICEITRVMLRPDTRGAGYASAAVRLAARAALVNHGLHRVEAQVYGDNFAGQRLFERSGFTREGIRRHAYWRRGQWLDGVLYGLLAEEL
ncbi:MAG: GNAT family N-acetyltransferase [Solirubrobacteraceae bacterium]